MAILDLSGIPIVDQHAHNLLRPEHLGPSTYLAAFTEGSAGEIVTRHVRETLFFRRSLRDLAALFGCAPDFGALLAVREELGFDETARRLFAAAGSDTVLLDDGFRPDLILPLAWHSRFARAYRVQRIEHLAEELIAGIATWSDFVEAFRTALRTLSAETLGLKSIVAYRTGLAVESADPAAAETCFRAIRRQVETDRSIRLAAKPLNDWIVWAALQEAARLGRPVQFHTGFGDPDLDLRLANPLHLRPLLETPAFRRVPFVLLHAGYPFTREAGYLAAVYPNVYVDLGLAIPFLSVAGMGSVIRSLWEIAPLSKVLFSTDAHFIPELFYLGAAWGRRVLSVELERATRDGDLTVADAEAAAERILRGNAIQLYGLPS